MNPMEDHVNLCFNQPDGKQPHENPSCSNQPSEQNGFDNYENGAGLKNVILFQTTHSPFRVKSPNDLETFAQG